MKTDIDMNEEKSHESNKAPEVFPIHGEIMSYRTIIAILCICLLSILFAPWRSAVAQQGTGNEIFNRMDADRNGVVDEQEWHTAMQNRFEATDRNRDGKLSFGEWQEMRDKMKQQIKSGWRRFR